MKKFNVTINGEAFAVEVEEVGGCFAAAPAPVAKPAPAPVAAPAPAPAPVAAPAPAPAPAPAAAPAAGGGEVFPSPLPGTVLRLQKKVGDHVNAGEVVLILEAMKMENDINATSAGTVTAIHVNAGQTVQTGDPLFTVG